MYLYLILEAFISIVVVSAFVPVFIALDAEYDLIRVILEMIARLFS